MQQIDVVKLFRQGVPKDSLIEMVYRLDKANHKKNEAKPTRKRAQEYVEGELYRDAMEYTA